MDTDLMRLIHHAPIDLEFALQVRRLKLTDDKIFGHPLRRPPRTPRGPVLWLHDYEISGLIDSIRDFFPRVTDILLHYRTLNPSVSAAMRNQTDGIPRLRLLDKLPEVLRPLEWVLPSCADGTRWVLYMQELDQKSDKLQRFMSNGPWRHATIGAQAFAFDRPQIYAPTSLPMALINGPLRVILDYARFRSGTDVKEYVAACETEEEKKVLLISKRPLHRYRRLSYEMCQQGLCRAMGPSMSALRKDFEQALLRQVSQAKVQEMDLTE
jgi:hypothetical protein